MWGHHLLMSLHWKDNLRTMYDVGDHTKNIFQEGVVVSKFLLDSCQAHKCNENKWELIVVLAALCKRESSSNSLSILVSGGLLPGRIRYRNERATWAGHKELGWVEEIWKIKSTHHSARHFGSPQHQLHANQNFAYLLVESLVCPQTGQVFNTPTSRPAELLESTVM